MYKFIWMLLIAALLAGCSQAKEPDLPVPVTAEFQLEPEKVKAGEITTIRVLVRQGDKPVHDAQEVEFEIWRDGQEKHDTVQAEHQGDGMYSIKERFHEPGKYFVIYHVTARDIHVMQQVEILVAGEEGQPPVESSNHHRHQEVEIHFLTDKGAKAKHPQFIVAHIVKDGHPFEGAKVQFEYWRASSPNSAHPYVDAIEVNPGEYQTEIVPDESGAYQIITHVEKNEIHEHQESSFVVQ